MTRAKTQAVTSRTVLHKKHEKALSLPRTPFDVNEAVLRKFHHLYYALDCECGGPGVAKVLLSDGADFRQPRRHASGTWAPRYALVCMELTLEAYRNIVKHLRNRADIANLCRVSKGFQYVCERPLYNTLYMRDVRHSISLCTTLADQPRLSVLVDALTIYLSAEDENDSDDDSEDDTRDGAESLHLPADYWTSIANALQQTTRLRYLNIHINCNSDRAVAWIFNKCAFQLRRFHCDLNWDQDLVAFLNQQTDLDDLYIIDYNETGATLPETMTTIPSPSLTLDTHSLPNLSTLECTFSEASVAIVPGRPITHLKTCFSRSDPSEKSAEMKLLFSKMKLSTQPLRGLDIADSTYSEAFSMELLACLVCTSAIATGELRYLGTLVLPILGKQVRYALFNVGSRLMTLCSLRVGVSLIATAILWPPDAPATCAVCRGGGVALDTCAGLAPRFPCARERNAVV
ncbi:hypothetical protein H0H81_002008 [Sphagnurus paluster]|uniref:Uncharacterized protein n=1 Tax=Sphagnurus paluster TaxID=117069 RepID=A0A9P7GN93_9AGAR|nr:hypothetical protein H0H81_002008 [Sphagnurus paluster]